MTSKYEARLFETTLRLPFFFLANSTYTKTLSFLLILMLKLKLLVMVIIRGMWYKGDDIAIKVLNDVNKIEPIHALIVGPYKMLNSIKKDISMNFPYTHSEFVNSKKLAEFYSSADVFYLYQELKASVFFSLS